MQIDEESACVAAFPGLSLTPIQGCSLLMIGCLLTLAMNVVILRVVARMRGR